MEYHSSTRYLSRGAFTRNLLATTALTAACGGSAVAGTITENQGGTPEFGKSQSTPTVLPVGTNVVMGFLAGAEDAVDWFELTGLTGGQAFTLLSMYSPGSQEDGFRMNVFTDTGTQIGGTISLESNANHTLNGIIPGDGNLVVEMVNLGSAAGSSGFYTDSLNPSPEPATLATAALALGAGALAWRRRRKQ